MKSTDFRREHFRNGASFSQADFDTYIQASDRYSKTFGIKYLACVAGGLLLSFLFSNAGGAAGNLLAVAAIFAGLIVGGAINAPALKAVNDAAKKLGITRADVKEATRNLKNGVTAWQGEASAGVVASQDVARAKPQATEPPVPVAQTNFTRATKLLWFLVVIWLVGTVLFLLPLDGLIVSLDSLFYLTYGVLAVGIYLLCFAQGKQHETGVLAVVLSFVMRLSLAFALQYVFSGRMINAVTGQLVPTILKTLLSTGVIVGAALLAKHGNPVNATTRVRVFASGAFLAYGVVNGVLMNAANAATFLDALFDAMIFAWLFFLAISLCNMPTSALRLLGVGRVYCWIAMIGGGATLVSNVVLSISTELGLDVFQLILPIFVFVGYALLLRNRKIGLYVILYATTIVIAASLFSAIKGLLNQSVEPMQLNSIVAVLLNPLFAWIVAREGEIKTSPVASPSKESHSSVPYVRSPAAPSPAVNVRLKPKSILDQYRAGLSYLDGCGIFDEAKFREFNRITGNRFTEADIQTQLRNAQMMINGMEEIKSALRSSMTEGIQTFEKLERNGIDLSKYNL